MTRHHAYFLLPFAVTLVVLGAWTTPGRAAESNIPPRMLLLTQSCGYAHHPVRRAEGKLSVAEVAMRQLADKSGEFTVHVTQDTAGEFTRKNLQNYDIVAFYTSGDLPIASEDLDYFLNEWLKERGHGFLGIHSATDTLKQNEAYWGRSLDSTSRRRRGDSQPGGL